MPYQDELLEGEVVSIWVGNLESQNAVIEYLGQPIERDSGFLLDNDDPPEIAGSLSTAPKMKSRRDDMTIAQGKRGTSAALGEPAPRIISLSSYGGEGWGEE